MVLKITNAGTGLASGRRIFATSLFPKVMSASQRGVPRSSSGGTTRASTMCSIMCRVNRDCSPMSWTGHPDTRARRKRALNHCQR